MGRKKLVSLREDVRKSKKRGYKRKIRIENENHEWVKTFELKVKLDNPRNIEKGKQQLQKIKQIFYFYGALRVEFQIKDITLKQYEKALEKAMYNRLAWNRLCDRHNYVKFTIYASYDFLERLCKYGDESDDIFSRIINKTFDSMDKNIYNKLPQKYIQRRQIGVFRGINFNKERIIQMFR